MSIKRRIWALPVISTIIFGLAIAVSAGIANGALNSIRTTEQVDYPVLDATKSLALDIAAVTSSLSDAVTEGDKARIAAVDEQAVKLHANLAKFSAIDGQQATGARLTKEFDDYYAPALSSARIMLEMDTGDAQGRGFAVVASEVRNLAQRSAAAAKEIKGLIGDSVAKVNAGSMLVDEAGITMGQIVESVKKVHDVMAEIKQAGQRQSQGIDDIGRAIASIDDMTQQNSALVEEASAAAESLLNQTDQLNGALAVFKLAPAPTPQSAEKRLALTRY